MVMPLWDASPLKLPKWPVVTWGLIAANVAVFIFSVAASSEIQAKLLAFAVTPALLTGDATAATGVSPYVTLVTHQFLHANLFHLLGNMIFLWVFGNDVEEAMGPVRFIAFYIGSGIAAALLFVASAPHSQEPLVGASGALAGVLAAYLMFRPARRWPYSSRGSCCGSSCARWCGPTPIGCLAAGCWCKSGKSRCRAMMTSPIWPIWGTGGRRSYVPLPAVSRGEVVRMCPAS
jgi:membrane associated rhomboid family serine protease